MPFLVLFYICKIAILSKHHHHYYYYHHHHYYCCHHHYHHHYHYHHHHHYHHHQHHHHHHKHHHYLGLHAIFVAKNGDWKIGALDLIVNMSVEVDYDYIKTYANLLTKPYICPER
jgi:hypothetical protein